jgi:spore germination protein
LGQFIKESVIKKMRRWTSKRRKHEVETPEKSDKKEPSPPSIDDFPGGFQTNLDRVRNEIGHNSDVHIREFMIGTTNIRAAIIFVDGLSDMELINNQILGRLMSAGQNESFTASLLSSDTIKDTILNRILSVSNIHEIQNAKKFSSEVLIGSVGLLVDGLPQGVILGVAKIKTRNIEEPASEALVRGPRVGFIESLNDNTAILRGLARNQSLSIIGYKVGERVQKDLAIAYIHDIANPELIEEVKKRVEKIDIDDLPESGYLEQLIEDNYLSPFPQVQSTERPDRVMGALLEGRVALLLDGTPFALIVPTTFNMLLQSPEDYYERWIPGTLIRLLRYLAAFIGLFAPSLYIAFSSFHQGLIPTKLAISIASTREGVPFPPLLEALIMEVAIEILREAGLRLPKPVGQSIGIVGGLIIGEATVQAGIVSPIMVIVVAITAISTFTLPQYNVGIAIRILRFIAMLFSAIFGLYGVVLFFLLVCIHVVKLKSFGVPYISPAVPYNLNDWKDFLIRAPLSLMKRRPKFMHTKDTIRKK